MVALIRRFYFNILDNLVAVNAGKNGSQSALKAAAICKATYI
jgi:hypothetical protein